MSTQTPPCMGAAHKNKSALPLRVSRERGAKEENMNKKKTHPTS
jgi:hypothetical protein